MSDDIKFMRRCLELARKAQGQTSPNPMVGCVLVKDNKILAEGYHHKAGQPHAEIEALKKIKFKAHGATLYCNLEPCFHHGKTPPCVHKIIESGITRVVIAHRDPNPQVAGQSIKLLKKMGVEVTVGVLEDEAKALNRIFLKWITQNTPYILLKLALSADGKIGVIRNNRLAPAAISGVVSLKRVHELRSQYDAVLIGKNTLFADNPRLNVRGLKKVKQPARIILDTYLQTPLNSKIFRTKGGPVIIATSNISERIIRKYKKLGSYVITHKVKHDKGIPLEKLLKNLASRNISSVMVEGGGRVARAFLDAGLVDEIILFISPKYLGKEAYGGVNLLFGNNLKQFTSAGLKKRGRDMEALFLKKN